MNRKLVYVIGILLFVFLGANKVEAKKYEFIIDGESEEIDLKEDVNLDDYVKEKYIDYYIKSIDEKKGKLILDKLVSVKIADNGKEEVRKAPNKKVGDILNFLGIKLDKADFVIPSLDKEPEEAGISIFRVKSTVSTVDQVKEFETLKIETYDANIKEETVKEEGRMGMKRVTKKETFINGTLKSSTVLKEETLFEAKNRIILVPANKIEIITRSAKRTYIMNATAYEAGPLSTGKRPGQRGYGITASGTRARRGTVAVDPRVIPLGTKLYIKSLDPSIPDYGYAIAEDTGGAIKGMKIDLFMDTVYECFQFGRRKVQVFILPAETPAEFFN